jgi:hypothetical protein
MTDTQEKKPTQTTAKTVQKEDNTAENSPAEEMLDQLKTKIREFFSSWKVRLTLIISILLGIFILTFYWQHIVAVWGMKQWSVRSGATPIECMVKDTNDDQYISCSAIRDQQIIPLECGANILNIGCRVNYGTAASPPVSGKK